MTMPDHPPELEHGAVFPPHAIYDHLDEMFNRAEANERSRDRGGVQPESGRYYVRDINVIKHVDCLRTLLTRPYPIKNHVRYYAYRPVDAKGESLRGFGNRVPLILQRISGLGGRRSHWIRINRSVGPFPFRLGELDTEGLRGASDFMERVVALESGDTQHEFDAYDRAGRLLEDLTRHEVIPTIE